MLCEANAMKRTGRPMSEEGLVMHELQHRMANSLAILQANCRVEFARVVDPELLQSLRKHELCILRLAELHRFLSRGAGHGEIEAADYFQPLCAVLSRSLLVPISVHCETFVGDGVLDSGTCEWLGLIVAELVMNAAKHAFPGRTDGRVRVDMYAPDGMAWCCTVSDNGCGMRNACGGAGSRIVNALVQLLDGQMAVDTGLGGTTVTIQFPGLRRHLPG